MKYAFLSSLAVVVLGIGVATAQTPEQGEPAASCGTDCETPARRAARRRADRSERSGPAPTTCCGGPKAATFRRSSPPVPQRRGASSGQARRSCTVAPPWMTIPFRAFASRSASGSTTNIPSAWRAAASSSAPARATSPPAATAPRTRRPLEGRSLTPTPAGRTRSWWHPRPPRRDRRRPFQQSAGRRRYRRNLQHRLLLLQPAGCDLRLPLHPV